MKAPFIYSYKKYSNMKPHMIRFLIVISLLAANPLAIAANRPLPVGQELPEIRLPIPSDISHKQYLGLTGEGTFKLSEIKASVVIIEIFSMYCPHCQREAPTVNEFFEKIEHDANL